MWCEPAVELSGHRADPAGQIALHASHRILMEEPSGGCPVEKDLYLAVLDFGRLRVLGVFNALHGRSEPGPHCSVTGVGGTTRPDALFRTLDIRQFGSSSLWILDYSYALVQRKV